MKNLFLVLALIFCSHTFANQKNEITIQSLVEDFFITKSQKHHPDPRCQQNNTNCLKVACSNLPTFECNDEDELREISNYCRGNYSGACLIQTLQYVRSYERDTRAEMGVFIKACRGVYGNGCLRASTAHLSSFEYDDKDEIVPLVESCKGTFDGECTQYVCQRIGRHRCDDLDEVIAINRQCAGTN